MRPNGWCGSLLHCACLVLVAMLACGGQAPLWAAPVPVSFEGDPEYLIDTWDMEHGLPENSATAMVQGPDGYLWFGTWNGLVRFDGMSFTVYDSESISRLPSPGIVNLWLDQAGRLWVSTGEGLVVREGERWTSRGPAQGWAGNFVRTFTERANGDLLITTFDGYVLEAVDGQLRELAPPLRGSDQGYQGAVDRTGRWWVAGGDFIGWWEGSRWVPITISGERRHDPAIPLAAARDGGIWILIGNSLIKIRGQEEVRRVAIPELQGGMWSLFEDSRGNVWICSYDSGLFRVDSSGAVRNWTTVNGLGNPGCRFVFEDREGNLWVGTNGGGLTRFKQRRFRSLDLDDPYVRSSSRSIAPAGGGGMWIATFTSGLLRYDGARLQKVDELFAAGASAYGLSVLEDRSGRVWYGDTSVLWWRREGEKFEPVPLSPNAGGNYGTLFEDSGGRIWIAPGQGVVMYDGAAFHELGTETGLTTKGITSFAEDPTGVVWLASRDGVFRYEERRFVEVRSEGGRPISGVVCMKSDPDGTMWLGTRSAGLLRLRDGAIDSIGVSSGLPDLEIHAILEDDQGFLWMTSNRGIVRVARQDLEAVAQGVQSNVDCQLLDRRDGLPSSEFPTAQPSCMRDADGQLWFATLRGVAVVDPRTFRVNAKPPPVHIERVEYSLPASASRRDGSSRRSHTAPLPERLRLPPGSHDLEVWFTATSLTSPERVRFQTRLEGTQKSWSHPSTMRTSRVHDLAPGSHVIQVRAVNEDGVWSDTPAALALTVQPYYWQTTAFQFGVLFALATGSGGIVWVHLRRRHEAELEQVERIRKQQAEMAHLTRVSLLGELSGSLAHELNQPLTAILSNAQAAQRYLAEDPPDLGEVREILADIVGEDERAGEVIRRMRRLLKKGEVQAQALNMNDVVQEALVLVNSNLVTHNCELREQLDPSSPTIRGDRIQLQQVIMNLAVNASDAMRLTAPQEAVLTVRTDRTDEGAVRVSVSDVGPGIDPAELEKVFEPFYSTKTHGMGLGLAVCQTIVRAHGGQLWATNNPGGGATFWFTLPVGEG